jgi:thioredoxin-related protein
MKSERLFRAAAFVTILCLGNAFAGGEGWSNDFEAAKKQAATEKKSLLLNFTGSDWCSWCVKLNQEVFQHDAFKNGVKDKLVLVEIDFPKDASKLSKEVIARNDVLKNQYAIEGFPTLFLTDEQGRPFARTGYKAGGPEAYVTHLNELLGIRDKRDAAFAEAAKADGAVKAEFLFKAITHIEELEYAIRSTFYAEEMKTIKAAQRDKAARIDSESKPQSKSSKSWKNMDRATHFKLKDFNTRLKELALNKDKDFEGAMKYIDETLAAGTFEGEPKQNVMFRKALFFIELKKTEDAIKTLDDAKAIAPEGYFSEQIDGLKYQLRSTLPK